MVYDWTATVTERRLTMRLLAYWEKLRASRAMPTEEDIDPDDIQDLWDYCFLLHSKDLAQPDYNFTYIGQEIIDAYSAGLAGHQDMGLLSPDAKTLLPRVAEVLSSKQPVLTEGELTSLKGEQILYRQCLLPLGERGEVIAIWGGMRFKIIARDA